MKEKPVPVFEVAEESGLFAVQRNGRYLMTPAGQPYLMPYEALARAVVEEWRAQGEKIAPATMPMTQLCATTFDIVRQGRSKIVAGLLAYVDSELLCHRTESLGALSARQQETWQPYLDWCADRFGAAFETGCGVMPVRQKAAVAQALGAPIEALDDYRLAGLSCACDSAGSLVLGLALEEKYRGAADILFAAELDATHQAETWGEDPVTRGRLDSVRRDLEACERWFGLLNS